MKKRLFLNTLALPAFILAVVGLSAFEAHVINVTASIENALFVPVEAEGLHFGTVFPEEVLDRDFEIRLSDSFLAQDRLDGVAYRLRQKPKCGVPVPGTDPVEYSAFVQVTDGPEGTFICPAGSALLPLLCPYLSKHELVADCQLSDIPGQGTCPGLEAFHGPLAGWDLEDTEATDLAGDLSIAAGKASSRWNIDLHAPCFAGQCAQDNVIPAAYQADPAYEHQLFGCDLWFEAVGLSPLPLLCGNGAQDGGEECDDGNLSSGDGCSPLCLNEFCGDGLVNDTNEECDDGAIAPGDGCNQNCFIEFCGDNEINNISEGCDDGGISPGDGCSGECAIEFCGDGIVNNSSEECDDGNAVPGDGCSEVCEPEL